MFQIKRILCLLFVAAAIAGVVTMFTPAKSSASIYTPIIAQVEFSALCDKLKTIDRHEYNSYCANKTYNSAADQNTAVQKVCADHQDKLKKECDAYTKAIQGSTTTDANNIDTGNQSCGDSAHGGPVKVAIDIGCKGKGNPILDMLFAIIRWLSDGVGLVIIGSLVVAGIQYSASRSEPQAVAQAVGRIRSTIFALLLYIFGYALLNYIIPAGFLK